MTDATTYETLRQFADSWMLLALVLFFAGVVMFVFRRGSKRNYEDASRIPFKDED